MPISLVHSTRAVHTLKSASEVNNKRVLALIQDGLLGHYMLDLIFKSAQ